MLPRALAIYETVFVPSHLYIGNNLVSLTRVLDGAGEVDKAEEVCRRAVAIHEIAMGVDQPTTGTTLSFLAHILEDKDELDKAEKLRLRRLAIDKKVRLVRHIQTLPMRSTSLR